MWDVIADFNFPVRVNCLSKLVLWPLKVVSTVGMERVCAMAVVWLECFHETSSLITIVAYRHHIGIGTTWVFDVIFDLMPTFILGPISLSRRYSDPEHGYKVLQ